jgi:tetratricopeptide (TPR) repeat protein
MFFTRSVLSTVWKWMKLPAGSSLPGAGGPEGPSLFPKRSRVFTAAVLAAAALLLTLPEGREAIRTVRASWQGFMMTNSDERKLEDLAARAERQKDAAMLAFVALSTRDSGRAQDLVEKAVALDVSYMWVYGARNHSLGGDPPRQEWLDRLRAADPDNAVPLLLEANAVAEPKVIPHYADKDYAGLANNPQWVALMEKAYAAPKYDSYLQKHFQLIRMAWERDRNLAPEIFLVGMWSHAIPDLRLVRVYGDMQIHEAKKAQAAGDRQEAERLANQVAEFGTRMGDSSGAWLEKLIGMTLSRNALRELAEVYTSEGKTEEARIAASKAAAIDEGFRRLQYDGPGRQERARALRWEAMLVQGSGILGGIAGIAALAGILMVELQSRKNGKRQPIWRRGACFAADYGPATMLVASGAFVVCFLPFQRALAEFRVSSYMGEDERRITDALWCLIAVPEYMLGVDATVAFWSMVTICLSVLAAVIVAWGFYRGRRAATKPA